MSDETTKLVSPSKRFPGHIVVPHPDYLRGDQFNQIRLISERRDKQKLDLSHSAAQKMAYVAAEFVADNGEWAIDGLTLDEFRACDSAPEKEPVSFAMWFGGAFSDWVNEVTNPKG